MLEWAPLNGYSLDQMYVSMVIELDVAFCYCEVGGFQHQ